VFLWVAAIFSAVPFCSGARHHGFEFASAGKEKLTANDTVIVTGDSGKGLESAKESGCIKDLHERFCCGSADGGTCKDGKRTPCPVDAADSQMQCGYEFFYGKKCQCQPNHCFSESAGVCINPETMPTTIGGENVEIPVKDMVTEVFKPDSHKSLAEEIHDTYNDLSFVDTAEEVASVVGSGATHTIIDTIGAALSPVIWTLASGGTRFSGNMARRLLSMDNDGVEKWLQWAISNFVVVHDDGRDNQKRCDVNGKIGGPLNIFGTRPDYGQCQLNMSGSPAPDQPLWAGPLFPYSNGKTGSLARSFNVSLSAKVGQVRCLEALQVQKSHCYGNLLSSGGFCDIELVPSEKCPLEVRDTELMIYCEGHCDVSQHALSFLDTTKRDFLVNETVYIHKEVDGKFAKVRGLETNGCKGGAKGIIYSQMKVPDYKGLRHCVRTQESNGDFTNLGCWGEDQLKHERDCSYVTTIGRWMFGESGKEAAMSQEVSKRQLFFRKFNIFLPYVKIRTRLYVHRTRSLQQVVNDEPEETQSATASVLQSFFEGTGTVLKAIQHPREFALSPEELVKQYKINTKEVKNAKGEVTGYELVTCKNPVWNNKTQAFDQPPLEKCFKLDIADLQLLATRSDYLSIEETASQKQPSQGIMSVLSQFVGGVTHGAFALVGYENVGFVLGAATKLARMLFVREVVLFKAPDENGDQKYCHDKWEESSSADDAYAVGVKCQYAHPDERGDNDKGSGIQANFEFEFMELPPIWNPDKNRNDMEIAIRGGYNLQFCRVLASTEPKSSAQPGMVICDLDAPTDENTSLVKPELLQNDARFRIEHIKYDTASRVVLGPSAPGSEAGSPQCQVAGGEESDCSEASDDSAKQAVEDASEHAVQDATDDSLTVRLKSTSTGQYCGIRMATHKKFGGIWSVSRPMLACDHEPGEVGPVELEGNIDVLLPSPIYDYLIILAFTCIGGGLGWTTGKWAALFGTGGTLYTVYSVVSTAVVFGAIGWMAQEAAASSFHLDGVMLRYLLKRKLQAVGQGILYNIEASMQFEFPRP
jgi:hypothetical protein